MENLNATNNAITDVAMVPLTPEELATLAAKPESELVFVTDEDEPVDAAPTLN